MTSATITITRAIVIAGNGPDHIHLLTDLPEATWPFKGNLSLKAQVAAGQGAEWVRNTLGMEPEVVGGKDYEDV